MEKIVVEIDAKTDGAIKNLDNLEQSILEVNEAAVQTEQGLEGIDSGAKTASTGIKGIGTALKAAGIGVALALFNKLAEVFSQNQKVADALSTVMNGVSLVFNDLVSFLVDNVGNVQKTFKAFFDDPLQGVKNLGQAIQDNLIERFNSLLEVFSGVGSGLVKLFKGDFSGAVESFKGAGKEMVDVFTGVDGTFDKVTESVTEYGSEIIKTAQKQTKLANSAKLAAAQQQLLVEQYDIEAEKLRQVRDEERNSIADRIKANDDLKLKLEEQAKAMRALADLQIASAQAELEKNNSIENQIALTEAIANKKGIEAQITGFLSEQKMNDLALDREKIELTQTKEEAENKLLIERKRFNAEQIDDEVKKLEALKLIDEEEAKIELARLQRVKDAAKEGTQAKIDADIALKEYEEEVRQQQIERDAELEEAKKEKEEQEREKRIKLAEEELSLEEQKRANKEKTFSLIQGLAGQETAVGRALLVFKAIQNAREQILDAKKALSKATLDGATSAVALQKGAAETAKVGFPQNIPLLIAYAVQAASIFSAVKQAVGATKREAGSAGAGGGSVPSLGSVPTTQSAPPAFNVVGQGGTSQLAQTIAGQQNEPIKAYVVSDDVSTAQSLDRNIVEGASI